MRTPTQLKHDHFLKQVLDDAAFTLSALNLETKNGMSHIVVTSQCPRRELMAEPSRNSKHGRLRTQLRDEMSAALPESRKLNRLVSCP